MDSVSSLSGRYVNAKPNGGAIVVVINSINSKKFDVLLMRANDKEGLHRFVIHRCIVEGYEETEYIYQGQTVGQHGEGEYLDKAIKNFKMSQCHDNITVIEIKEYKYPTSSADLMNGPTNDENLLFTSTYTFKGPVLNLFIEKHAEMKMREITFEKKDSIRRRYSMEPIICSRQVKVKLAPATTRCVVYEKRKADKMKENDDNPFPSQEDALFLGISSQGDPKLSDQHSEDNPQLVNPPLVSRSKKKSRSKIVKKYFASSSCKRSL